jgi:hypothetical protein|tara:strand:- start:7746 stop:8003 length:258 start_codon:yes stop_codon:yes gene_type:complete
MIKSPDFSNTNTQQTNLYDQIDLSTTTSIHCEECEGKAFKQTLLLRRLSSIISPTGKEIVIPISAFACETCGRIAHQLFESEFQL